MLSLSLSLKHSRSKDSLFYRFRSASNKVSSSKCASSIMALTFLSFVLFRLIAEFPNAFIGFTGILTFPDAHQLRRTAQSVPLDRILLVSIFTCAFHFQHPHYFSTLY